MKDKYNNLTVIKEVEKFVLPSGQTNRAFLCRCDCGKEKVVRMLHLVNYRVKTCGCQNKDVFGESNSKIYKIWNSIKTRCKPNYFESKNYYDKGIRVCDEWLNSYQAFKEFCLNNGFKCDLTIDRINSNGNYEPNNVRFVTQKVNCNNRSNTIMVNYKNELISLRLLVEKYQIQTSASTIIARLKRGYDIEKAINAPIKNNYKNRKKNS